jgi:GNAT superfamily N-acetyltransferase
MEIATRELSRLERAILQQHLLALGSEDRRLRFGIALPDQGIKDYVSGINFEHDAVFGVFDDSLHLVAAAHLARCQGHAELGVSVLPDWRGRGAGAALLARSHTHARNWGIRALFMHCLSENGAMMHLARKQGMCIVTQQGETDAWLELPPADASSYVHELLAERLGLFDFTLKRQLYAVRSIADALRLRPGTA